MSGLLRFAALAPVLTLAIVPPDIHAQELDTAIASAPPKHSTILDQIDRPDERRAFKALYGLEDPRRRVAAARAFLDKYPDSWFLAEVYEIAAKASIDVGDLPGAVEYGRQSLRLLPENALLLVPLANVQFRQGLLQDAEDSAHSAVEYLDRFARPSSVRLAEWPSVQSQLRSSALYVLGRVRVSEGLAATGAERLGKLEAAAADLSAAVRINPEDPQPAYVLGLAELSMARIDAAAGAFANAARLPGPLAAKSLAKLKELGRTLDQCPPLAQPRVPDEPGPSPGEYAGSDKCLPCHARECDGWRQTGMANMLRPYQPENVFGDFHRVNFEDNSGRIVARMGLEKGRPYFSARGEDGGWLNYPVDYTIGSKWQQAYATRMSDGQIHVFPIQYNRVEGSWVNYWKLIDPEGSERPDPDLFHTMSRRTNYQENCAPCHTSQLRVRDPRSPDTRTLVFQEPGVNCEMCHGPSARHVTAMTAGKPYPKRAADPPVDFAGIDNRSSVRICGQCHMQSAIREPGPGGEYNYSASGGSFLVRYANRSYVDFSRKAFYKDGRFRETTFIAEAFMRSACYRKGEASCVSCHNPHPADAAANPTSLKFRDNPDRMCLQCHSSYAGRIEAHTHHPARSEASRCVSCHMPRIMNSLLFLARTHRIDDIPDAGMTLRFGQRGSPNACLLCHQDKNAQWVASRLQSW